MSVNSRESLEIPHVPSPYEGRKLKGVQHICISAYWFATNFLWGAMLSLVLPNQVEYLIPGLKAQALGLISSLTAIVALVVPLIAGALSDRCAHRWGRRRPYMVTGILLNLIGLVLMALVITGAKPSAITADGSWAVPKLLATQSYVLYMLAYIIVQFGNNIASAAYSGIIPDLVPEDQRGVASGYMALMTQVGTLCGVVVCGPLLDHSPEWVKFAVMGIVLAGVATFTLLGIRETPLPAKPKKIEWGPYVKSLWIDPKTYPDFAWVWITRALVMVGFYAILFYVNYFLKDVIHVAKEDVGKASSVVFGVILIFSSVSGYYGGKISDVIGRKKVVYIANSLIAVTVLGFMLCHNLIQLAVVGSLFGLGFGAYTSVDWALGTDVLPSKKDAAKEMAVWHIAMTLPQSIGPVIAASMLSHYVTSTGPTPEDTHYAATGYGLVFVFCAICFGLGAYLLRNVRGVK